MNIHKKQTGKMNKLNHKKVLLNVNSKKIKVKKYEQNDTTINHKKNSQFSPNEQVKLCIKYNYYVCTHSHI
jgi:hypothetical protein